MAAWAGRCCLRKPEQNEGGLFGVLMDLPPSFTVIPETTWRWGNAISALLVPQRGFLMGLPLATIAFTQWWLATDKTRQAEKPVTGKKPRQRPGQRTFGPKTRHTRFPIATRRMIAAGVAAGLLPLVHAHSFVVVMANGGLSGVDSNALARVVCVLCRGVCDRDPATALVHDAQRG